MENVNTENKATVETKEVKTSLFGKLKEVATSPRTQRTAAAALGAGIGIAATATSSRASKTSIGFTVGFGLVGVLATNKSQHLEEEYETNLSSLALIACMRAAETSVTGYLANRIVGKKQQADKVDETAANAEELNQPKVEEVSKAASIFEAAKDLFKPKQTEVPVEVKPEVPVETKPQTVTE